MGLFSPTPRQDPGHPLTPQPGPSTPGTRREIAARLRLADELNANPDALDQLVELHDHLARQLAGLHRFAAPLPISFSGLAVLDVNGLWDHQAKTGSSSIWVDAINAPLWVAAQPRTAAPPSQGSGVFFVPAGCDRTFNARTNAWTLYGAGPGGLTSTPVPQPATATDWTWTVPYELSLTAVTAQLATGGTAALPILQIKTASGSVIYEVEASVAEGASAVNNWVWAVGTPALNDGAFVGNVPLPPLTLPAGSTIGTLTSGLAAGDQWSQIVITGTEAGGTQASAAGAMANVTIFGTPQDPT